MTNEITNPYVGLRPFEMEESLLFFGRNEQTMELLQRLHQHHFVAVVGSSGCGKSSLLRAGLIPSLKAGYLVDDNDHWFIAIMKPGQNPLYHLADALLRQVNMSTSEEEIKKFAEKISEDGIDAIYTLLLPLHKKDNTNFFLLIDQFEELFRFAKDQKDAAKKDEAIDFVNIMLELSNQKDIPVYVVITMRSDFIGDCAQFFGLPEAMNKSQYLVPKLSRIEMKMVIEGPAKLYGGKFNASLTSRLLNDLGKVKDELPLLQHALMRMWDFEMTEDKSGEIDLKDYERIGGLEKTLSNHADEALNGMTEDEIKITKNIFQSLSTIDENGRKIRRPAQLSHLAAITGAGKNEILRIINRFIDDKRSFLIINKTKNADDPLIDISHESLIRQWSTLGKWVDEEGENVQVLMRLVYAEKLFSAGKKDYLSGNELTQILHWYKEFKPTSTWMDRYTTDAEKKIKYLLDSEQEMKKELEEKQSQKRFRKRVKWIVGGVAGLAILFIAINTYYQTQLRHSQLKKQNYIHLAGNSKKQGDYLKELLLSAEALNQTTNTKEEILHANKMMPLYYLRLIFIQNTDPLWATFEDSISAIKIWVDSDKSYTWSLSDSVYVSDSSNTDLVPAITMYDVLDAVFHLFLKWDIDTSSGKFKVLDMMNWNDIRELKVPANLSRIDGGSFSHDKKKIVIWGQNKDGIYTANIFDAETGKQLSTPLLHTNEFYYCHFNKEGKRILSWGGDSTVRLWQKIDSIPQHKADFDYPPDLFLLQSQVLTGVELDPQTNEIKDIKPNDWVNRFSEWKEKSEQHFKTCKFKDENYWYMIMKEFSLQKKD